MNVCDICNIVHDETYCPLCIANEKIEELETKVEELEEYKWMYEDLQE